MQGGNRDLPMALGLRLHAAGNRDLPMALGLRLHARGNCDLLMASGLRMHAMQDTNLLTLAYTFNAQLLSILSQWAGTDVTI